MPSRSGSVRVAWPLALRASRLLMVSLQRSAVSRQPLGDSCSRSRSVAKGQACA
ncbi:MULTISPECIES: hypothetical protein [Moorena]|uniref:hypothetical protein n=1 Tax=Moorena TaxID=1155738 RepID=UPI0002E59404|nr:MULTISPECIES: hypothetical protein [Moorena]NEQ12602.1 hypothetical protein [Moorena sp. SIO3E2]NEP35334.1 hypothetical protein [Moorena sp. SIO3B2]NEP63950.1 hypothetical protein [Moorena sp. SIO3A5]NER87052.1 hypothetical protein [Moorena sp. SIO3A2]NES40919.1 hypothetical protein [Moorena sp. SIO2C4]